MSDANSSSGGSHHESGCAEETPLSSGFPSPVEGKGNYVGPETCANEPVDVARMANQNPPNHSYTIEDNTHHEHDLGSAEQGQDYMKQRQSHIRPHYDEVRPEEAFGRRSSQLSSLLDDEFTDQDSEFHPTEEHVEKARAKVQQYSQYIHVMEERVSLIESKIRKMEKTDETVKSSKPKPKELHLPAIPELHFVKWFDFKHKYADDKKVYAIEVLVGNARYFHQYKIDEQIRKYVARGGIYESDSIPQVSQADYTPGSLQEMPGRIRINSHPLLAVLSHIAAKDWSMRPRVLLKPYKLLVHFESEIREYLKKLEDKWAHADIPQLHGRSAQVGSHSSARMDHQVDSHAEKNANVADAHRELGDNVEGASHRVPESMNSDIKTHAGVHEEKQLNDFEDILESYEALSGLKCLVRFMNRYLSPVLKHFNKASLKKIEFEDLWYLFKPGDEVYAPAPKVAAMEINHQTSPEKARRPNRYQTAWRVLYVGGGRPALTADEETKPLLEARPHDFILTCYYLDYNGREYGPICCNFVIKPFEGAIDIISLEVYPWKYAKMGPTIRERLRKEGELFQEYVDAKHLTYDGTSLTHHPCGRPLLVPGAPNHPEGIEGQVIVGFEEGVQIDPGWLAPIGFPDEMNVFSSEVVESYPTRVWTDRDQVTSTDSWTDIIHSDISIDKLRYTELVESDPFLRAWESRYFNENSVDDGVLRDEDLILLPTRVLAYVFRERKFALLSLQSLRKCRIDVDGFGNLKLLPGYKKMVKSLVMTHFMKKKASITSGGNDTMDFDVVYGKSRGLIILLHGVPGMSGLKCV